MDIQTTDDILQFVKPLKTYKLCLIQRQSKPSRLEKHIRFSHLARRILMLGAGFVAKPALRLLHDHGFKIIVGESHPKFPGDAQTDEFSGCVDLNAARSLCRDLNNAEAKYLDVLDTSVLDAEVAKVDLVISLIPYVFHVQVIGSAIRNAKNVVTTSYISPSMASLHQGNFSP